MRRVERFLFPAASAERLAGVRIGLCAVLAGRLATGPYAELADQPRELYRPISFMELSCRRCHRDLRWSRYRRPGSWRPSWLRSACARG